jgi:hypothetical protein
MNLSFDVFNIRLNFQNILVFRFPSHSLTHSFSSCFLLQELKPNEMYEMRLDIFFFAPPSLEHAGCVDFFFLLFFILFHLFPSSIHFEYVWMYVCMYIFVQHTYMFAEVESQMWKRRRCCIYVSKRRKEQSREKIEDGRNVLISRRGTCYCMCMCFTQHYYTQQEINFVKFFTQMFKLFTVQTCLLH